VESFSVCTKATERPPRPKKIKRGEKLKKKTLESQRNDKGEQLPIEKLFEIPALK